MIEVQFGAGDFRCQMQAGVGKVAGIWRGVWGRRLVARAVTCTPTAICLSVRILAVVTVALRRRRGRTSTASLVVTRTPRVFLGDERLDVGGDPVAGNQQSRIVRGRGGSGGWGR